MPWFSYHGGHSGQYCRHAKGEAAAVVERAIECGFTHYGLSEHCPRDRAEDLFPDEKDLAPADLARTFAAYTRDAFALRDRYGDRIDLLVGFETERLPPGRWEARMRELRASAPFDYVIGSVHDVGGICIDYNVEGTRAAADANGGVEALQIAYFDAVTDLVQTLKPEVVGHIDLIRKFDGADARFSPRVFQHIERALEAARAAGSVLDVNAAPARRKLGAVYPLPEILERARVIGVGVTLGDDGHGPHDVGVGLDACMQAIAAAGYREVHYLAHVDGAARLCSAPLADVRPASRA